MQPWESLPVHPLLHQLIDSIVIMKVDSFAALPVSSTFDYPWTAQINLFFTLSEKAVSVRSGDATEFEPYPHHFLRGPYLQQNQVQCPDTHHVLCVAFRPAAFRRLYGIPVSEIINRYVEISLLGDIALVELSRRLETTKDNAAAHELVQHYFFRKLNELPQLQAIDGAIGAILNTSGNISMDTVADIASLSTRQLERRCNERLGVNPKLFARLTRFAKAYMIKELQPELNWTNIAYDRGYYDQMHMVRDFKMFSGATPSKVETTLNTSLNAMNALQSKPL